MITYNSLFTCWKTIYRPDICNRMEHVIGVIGAGHMGKRHVRVSHTLGVLGPVFDTDPAAKAVAEQYNAEFFTDFKAFDDHLDAVIISTPPQSHFPLAMMAIEKGMSVLVEKPITIDPAEGERLVDAAKDADVSLAVGHVERFNPAYMMLRERIETPDYVLTDRHSPRPDRILGPALYDIGVHDIDLSIDLIGSDPVSMHSTMSENGEMGLLRFQFEDGASTVRFNRTSMVKVREVTVTKGNDVLTADIMHQGVYSPDGAFEKAENVMEPIEAEIRDFLDTMEHRKPTVCGDVGLRAVRLAHLAENRSGDGWIDLD